MLKFERPLVTKSFMNIYFLHKDLFYWIPTIQTDLNPYPKGILGIRIYLFNLVIQITI